MRAKKSNLLKQLFAFGILAVFMLAITPWGALHHHEEEAPINEKHCTHTVHVKTSTEHCLVCKAHFEKNYTNDFDTFLIYLKTNPIKLVFKLAGKPFTSIISRCLRGPPSGS
jgi:hypothetical protein